MPNSNSNPDLAGAFTALRTYDLGSSRAALLPLDEAAQACLKEPSARTALEHRLIEALEAGGSAVAREYICSKLALMGTETCVPTLASLLAAPAVGTAARNALQLIPSNGAAKALRRSLERLGGSPRLGVIHSLGARRDVESVRTLTRLLSATDPETVAAAAGALGDIASVKAGKALRAFLSGRPANVPPRVADAALAGAEHLLAEGHKPEAMALYQSVAATSQPAHIRAAAARGLTIGH